MTLRTFFGDAEHDFALTAPLIAELEAVTGIGIGGLARRLEAREFKLDDITHTIRLALVGGGTDPETAARLVANYVPARPLIAAHLLAVEIMHGLWFGTAGEGPADPDAAATLSTLAGGVA